MTRLDSELVRRGIAKSRERAKEYIRSGSVSVAGRPSLKPSDEVSESDEITFTGEALRYVGRGGLKLEKALDAFKIDLSGLCCLDIGASTGGFTDCMLQRGAGFVYAVDVGHGQLAEKLMNDSRVKSIEGVNVKDISREIFDRKIDFVCADLSFISSKFSADAAARVLETGGSAVLLIKPQFEAGRASLSKSGVVKDKKAHEAVLKALCGYYNSAGFGIRGLIPSPIRGGDGNVEYLIYLVKQESFTPFDIDFSDLCGRAFAKKG